MTTENPNIEIVIDPTTYETSSSILFSHGEEPKMLVTVGCIDAADQMEDLLNKFTCLPPDMKTLVWKYLSNFVTSRGWKIVEAGGVIPQ